MNKDFFSILAIKSQRLSNNSHYLGSSLFITG